MDMTVEHSPSRRHHCQRYDSTSSTTTTPPHRHHSTTTNPRCHPPNSPVVVAQAQSTIVSPNRADSLSPPRGLDSRQQGRHQTPSPSSSPRQRLPSPDDVMTISSSSSSTPPAAELSLHSDRTSAHVTQSGADGGCPINISIRGYPREQLDSSSSSYVLHNRNISNEQSLIATTTISLKEENSTNNNTNNNMFKLPLHIQHRPDQSSIDSVKQKFFFTSDVLQQQQQQKHCYGTKVTLPSIAKIQKKCGAYHELHGTNEASPLLYVERKPDIAHLSRIKNIRISSKYPSPDSSPSSSPLPPPMQLQEPTLKLDPTQYAIIDYSKHQFGGNITSSINNRSVINNINDTTTNNDDNTDEFVVVSRSPCPQQQYDNDDEQQQHQLQYSQYGNQRNFIKEEFTHQQQQQQDYRRRSSDDDSSSTSYQVTTTNISDHHRAPTQTSPQSSPLHDVDYYSSGSGCPRNTPAATTIQGGNNSSGSGSSSSTDTMVAASRGTSGHHHHHGGLVLDSPAHSVSSTMSSLPPIAEGDPSAESNSGNLIAVIDKLIIEFDGTTLLCRVCGDRSSGFHYGVHSCEGCKGFFRRSIQQKIQYRPCNKNQVCHVQKTNRNRCQYCRLKKCIEVGMSKDAVRFGRVPKNEKERIRQAMAKASNNSCPQQEVNDDYLISVITKSHMETCSSARDNVKDILIRADESPRYAAIDPMANCPLNPYVGSEDFQQKFSPIVREVVTFAKNIPGFVDLKHEDKINLLRACVFEVLLIRFSALVDPKNKRMISVSGSIIFTNIYSNIKASSDFVDTLFTFVDRINSLSLSDEEMALFTAAIVINPKRQGLSDLNKISCIHKRIVHCLHIVMQRERPNNPNLSHELISTLNDLWILNGMHSKQTQAKPRMNSMDDTSMDIGTTNNHFSEPSSNSKYYNSFSTMQCPVASSPDYEDKRMTTDEGLPTSPTSNYSQDEAMQSPGSADSGCSVDSGCSSAESDASYDSGCSITSHSARPHSMIAENHREVISTEVEHNDNYRSNCNVKRKPVINSEESNRAESDKTRSSTWHKPQKTSEKPSDSPVLRMCLESPSVLKMEGFTDYYPRGHGSSHPHKKFRPAMDRSTYSHETLDSFSSSPRPSTSPSPSFSNSPSPSSSISSSPSRISSSPYSSTSMSSPASPGNISILAHRLAMPIKKYPKASPLLQSLSQDSKFVNAKTLVSDALHECIMNGQSKVSRQHVMVAPSPSRYDDLRNTSPMMTNNNMSPPHHMVVSPSLSNLLQHQHHNSSSSYRYSSSSPPLTSSTNSHIPQAHTPPFHTPTGLGASAMSGCMSPENYNMCEDDAQPLNLSTKTPSPPPVMES